MTASGNCGSRGLGMRVRASLGLGGCFLIVHVLFLLAMPATTSASSYPDVAVDHPYYAAIDDLSDRGVISGFIDGTFGPNAPITRQQFAKMIVLALGLEPVAGDQCQFVDVDAGWPYHVGSWRPPRHMASPTAGTLCTLPPTPT